MEPALPSHGSLHGALEAVFVPLSGARFHQTGNPEHFAASDFGQRLPSKIVPALARWAFQEILTLASSHRFDAGQKFLKMRSLHPRKPLRPFWDANKAFEASSAAHPHALDALTAQRSPGAATD